MFVLKSKTEKSVYFFVKFVLPIYLMAKISNVESYIKSDPRSQSVAFRGGNGDITKGSLKKSYFFSGPVTKASPPRA